MHSSANRRKEGPLVGTLPSSLTISSFDWCLLCSLIAPFPLPSLSRFSRVTNMQRFFLFLCLGIITFHVLKQMQPYSFCYSQVTITWGQDYCKICRLRYSYDSIRFIASYHVGNNMKCSHENRKLIYQSIQSNTILKNEDTLQGSFPVKVACFLFSKRLITR